MAFASSRMMKTNSVVFVQILSLYLISTSSLTVSAFLSNQNHRSYAHHLNKLIHEHTQKQKNGNSMIPTKTKSQLFLIYDRRSTQSFSSLRATNPVEHSSSSGELQSETTNSSINKNNNKKKLLTLTLSATILSTLIFLLNRQSPLLNNFNFKEFLAEKLDYLASLGPKGLILYIFLMMVWEITVGVTTPVETAAAMAFGLQNGILANAIGKMSGAVMAFCLGRFVFEKKVSQKLKGNEYMELVKDSIQKNPIRVSLIWRFSFLPEQIKNFGLAVLPVKTWQFLLAVVLHGFPFTVLWSFMGNEMGMLVKGVVSEPSRILKVLIGGVYVFGFFISPTLVGLWVKGLRDDQQRRKNNNDMNEATN